MTSPIELFYRKSKTQTLTFQEVVKYCEILHPPTPYPSTEVKAKQAILIGAHLWILNI